MTVTLKADSRPRLTRLEAYQRLCSILGEGCILATALREDSVAASLGEINNEIQMRLARGGVQ